MVGLVDRRLLSSGSLRAVLVGAVECGMSAADGVEGAACRLLVGAKTELLRLRPRQASPPEETGQPPAWLHPPGGQAHRPEGRAGPYPPLGAASCGLAVYSLHGPCAPLLPVPPGGLARHCVPRPSAAWHSCPILGTGTHCTHVRAGCCCCCEPRPARPRRCCFHPPLLPAAHAVGTCAAHCCAPTQTTGWAGG